MCLLGLAYLQIPVVHGAAAVGGLSGVLAGVEQATQFAEEPGPRHDELHSC